MRDYLHEAEVRCFAAATDNELTNFLAQLALVIVGIIVIVVVDFVVLAVVIVVVVVTRLVLIVVNAQFVDERVTISGVCVDVRLALPEPFLNEFTCVAVVAAPRPLRIFKRLANSNKLFDLFKYTQKNSFSTHGNTDDTTPLRPTVLFGTSLRLTPPTRRCDAQVRRASHVRAAMCDVTF